MSRPPGGRGVARLAADFGHPLPRAVPPAPAGRDAEAFTEIVGRRGHARPAAGWAAVPAPLSVWRMTSEQVGGVWPLIAADGVAPTGALMGFDWLSGGAFYADPIGWTLTSDTGVTNPNVIIFGTAGKGKSATVKAFCLRMMPYGYRVLILGDIKDEYEPLCRALGVAPFAIGHGLPARINPLAFGPLGAGWEALTAAEAQRRAAVVFARWLQLLRGLVGARRVPFGPAESAVAEVLRQLTGYATGASRLTEITLPALWHALDDPSPELIGTCRYAGRQHFLDETRPVRDALGALVKGIRSLRSGSPTISSTPTP